MKVLLVGDTNYVHVRRWAHGFERAGLQVSVLSSSRTRVDGVEIVDGATPPFRPWRPFRWLQRWKDHWRTVLKETKPDLINVHFPGAFSVPIELIKDYPLVVSTWGIEVLPMAPEDPSDRIRKVELLRRADSVLASSRYLGEATARYADLPADRVQTIYWGVDLDLFTPTPGTNPKRPDGRLIGIAKALTPKYGYEYLIDALPRVLREFRDTRLLVLGDGPLGPALRDQASKLGIENSIDWRGPVPHGEMPAYFMTMDLSVLPSTHDSETLGVAALESQAMSIPVVASRIGGLPESVCHGETGILVPPQDTDALARAIINLLSNDELRTQMGRNGRSFVERRFDWRQTLESTVAAFERVIR